MDVVWIKTQIPWSSRIFFPDSRVSLGSIFLPGQRVMCLSWPCENMGWSLTRIPVLFNSWRRPDQGYWGWML